MDNEIMVSVFKESLFSENVQAQSTIYKLVSKENVEGGSQNRKSIPYFFSGSAVFSNSKKEVPDSTQLVFYLNNSDFVYQVFTNRRGEFSFPLFKNFSDEEVFYSAFMKGVQVDSIVLDLNVFQYTGEKISVSPSKIPDPLFEYREKLTSIEDSYAYFTTDNKGSAVQNSDWWPDVDYEVNLTKLEPFITMEEVFQNVVSLVRYKKSPDGDGIRIFLKKITQYAIKDPVFIIDGTMTDNINYFVNLDPLLVKRIGICRTPEVLARYGLLGENGIVVVETTSKSFPLKERTDKSFWVTGISKALEFQELKLDQNSRVPVFKSCLYWNPNLAHTETGNYEFQFNTSDDLGYFLIQLTSVDKAGRIHSRQERILVTPSR
jgi:hypothetical protein